jgi:hypothetical protein
VRVLNDSSQTALLVRRTNPHNHSSYFGDEVAESTSH